MTAPDEGPTTEAPAAGPDTSGHAEAIGEETRPLSAIDTPTPIPFPTRMDAYERFETVFADVQGPFAFVDLDAVWAKAADLERHAVAPDQLVQRPKPDAALNLDEPRLALDLQHPGELAHFDQDSPGARSVREGVAGADRPHSQSLGWLPA